MATSKKAEKKKKNQYPKKKNLKLELKKKKKQHTGWSPYASTNGHFYHLSIRLPPPNFLSIFGRKLFDRPGKKTQWPHHSFPLSTSQLNTLQKVLLSLSLSLNFFFFILPKIHSTKNTNVRATTWWQQIKEQSKTTKFFWLRDDDKNLQDLNSILKKLNARSEFHPNGSKNLKTLLPNVLKL